MNFFSIFKKFFDKKEITKLTIYFVFSVIAPILELLSLGSLAALIVYILDDKKFDEIFDFNLVDQLLNQFSNIELINIILFTIIVLFILKNLFLIIFNYIETKLRYTLLASKQKKLYNLYYSSKYLHFKNFSRSEIFNNIMIEPGRVIQYIFSWILIIREGLLAFLLFFSLFFIDFYYSSILIVSLLFISLLLYFLFNKQLLKIGDALRKITQRLVNIINETQNLFKIIVFKNKRNFFFDFFDKVINSRTKNIIKQDFVKKVPKYLFETFLVCLICIILFFYNDGKGGIKDLLPYLSVLALISLKLLPIFSSLNSLLSSIKFSQASFDNYINMSKKLENSSSKINQESENDNQNTTINFLQIKNLSFSYEKENLLSDLNFKIEKGKIFGIFGRSGSGKSTLVDLISGLLTPNQGQILIDGKEDIFKKLGFWQNNIGYVTQENLLMNDTIKNNICLGVDEKFIDYEKLNKVLEQVELDKIIMKFKEKMNTNLGDLGAKISGGQKQRINIARALYMEPKILIFDEATSALDKNSEDLIIKIINNIKNEKIVIMISHDIRLKKICNNSYQIN